MAKTPPPSRSRLLRFAPITLHVIDGLLVLLALLHLRGLPWERLFWADWFLGLGALAAGAWLSLLALELRRE